MDENSFSNTLYYTTLALTLFTRAYEIFVYFKTETFEVWNLQKIPIDTVEIGVPLA
jgi:hypothetical protein